MPLWDRYGTGGSIYSLTTESEVRINFYRLRSIMGTAWPGGTCPFAIPGLPKPGGAEATTLFLKFRGADLSGKVDFALRLSSFSGSQAFDLI